jgi:prepilin-type N-terminal cleavage/methylation domain-containing protein
MSPREASRQRGYTVIELMMSLSVLAIGASGIIAMQKVTVASGAHSKNLAVATRVASAWADALAADSSLWNSPSDLIETTWLQNLTSGQTTTQWFRPEYSALRRFGPGFSALGDPVQDPNHAHFCTDIRLTWLRNDPNLPGASLMRAEIRVFWRSDRVWPELDIPANICDPDANSPLTLENENVADAFHFVHLTTAIAQTGTE